MFTRKVTGLSLLSVLVTATLAAHAAPPAGTGKPANPGPPPFAPVDFCTARPNSALTIQQAVDRGCTDITVAPGIYRENVVISVDHTAPITITGTDGAANTIVDGGGNDRVLFNVGANVTLTGLTIQNGSTPNGGGGIINGRRLTLNNCVVTNNTANFGGGIHNDFGALTLNNTSVTGNTALYAGSDTGGGGIYSFSFSYNFYNDGLGEHGVVTLNNSSVTGNTTAGAGGGIYLEGVALKLTNSSLSGNTASEGGGIFVFGAVLELTDSSVTGNTATYDGGGIYFVDYDEVGTFTLRGTSLVTGNTPNNIVGDPVYL